jgi:hypothetical protein
VCRADVMELLGHDVLREFRLVTFAAQVGEVKVAQFGGHDLRGGFGGGDVREMAVAAEDALLEAPRAARAILQHLHVVIGFEHEDVCGADAVEHELGCVAEVGGKADVADVGAEQVADRILCVVRDRKGFDQYIADFKACAGSKKLPVYFRLQMFRPVEAFKCGIFFAGPFGLEGPDGGVLRVAVAKNGDLIFVRQTEQSGDVVAVFVCDQDGGEVFRHAADACKALADLQRRKSGVHEDAGPDGLDVGAIAAGAAAEDGEFDGHKGKLKRKAESGKRKKRGQIFSARNLTVGAVFVMALNSGGKSV